jgi:hypothetical protein
MAAQAIAAPLVGNVPEVRPLDCHLYTPDWPILSEGRHFRNRLRKFFVNRSRICGFLWRAEVFQATKDRHKPLILQGLWPLRFDVEQRCGADCRHCPSRPIE